MPPRLFLMTNKKDTVPLPEDLRVFLTVIRKAGFADIRIERTKKIAIPDEVLQAHLDADTIQKYKAGNVGIYSITVTGQKRT